MVKKKGSHDKRHKSTIHSVLTWKDAVLLTLVKRQNTVTPCVSNGPLFMVLLGMFLVKDSASAVRTAAGLDL